MDFYIGEAKTNKEYHENGVLSYVDTLQEVDYVKATEAGVTNMRYTEKNGKKTYRIRVGINAKTSKKGETEWAFLYDAFGNIERKFLKGAWRELHPNGVAIM